MNTSEFAKKIAILVSGDNKIWGDASFCQEEGKICKNTIGANYTTIQTWLTKQGKYPRKPSIEKMCNSINEFKNELEREVKESDFSDDDISVFEFAKIFGINDRDRCCKILDERIYYWELPLLPCLYYDDKDRAGSVLERYKGFYDVYRRGTSAHNEKDIYIMKLQVRYLLSAHNRTAIRCKLNLPDQRRSILEYDGFVSEFDNYVYWLFEARHHPGLRQRDCILMLTKSADRFDDDMRMDGIYLSVSQDASPKPVSRNIMLIRRYNELNDEDKRNFMKGNMSANIIKGGQGVGSEIIAKL